MKNEKLIKFYTILVKYNKIKIKKKKLKNYGNKGK